MSEESDAYFVVINVTPERQSRFSRIRNYLSQKISNLMFNVRKQASRIVINGRRIVTPPDGEIPREIRSLSVKQLRKLREALVDLEAEGYNAEKHGYLRKPGTVAQRPSPRNGSDDDDDDDGIIITRQYDIKNEKLVQDGQSECSDIASNLSHTSVRSIRQEDTADNEAGENQVEADEAKTESSAEGIPEIPFEAKRLMRKNRPKAAKGERSSTAIPSYIVIDEDRNVVISPRKRKRPNAAKGKRKLPTGNSDLIDLPADVLIEKFKDPKMEAKQKVRTRPQAPRGRHASKVAEGDTLLSTIEAKPKVINVAPCKDTIEEDTESLDELLYDLGVITARDYPKPTRRRESRQRELEVIDLDEQDAMDEEETDDIFNVPYLPKSQRRLAMDYVRFLGYHLYPSDENDSNQDLTEFVTSNKEKGNDLPWRN